MKPRLIFLAPLVIIMLMPPGHALASCEGLLSVHSRELAFTYIEPTPNDADSWTPDARREYHRSLAHALAVAQRAFELARAGSRTPRDSAAARVVLLARGRPAPEDLDDPSAVAIARDGAKATLDSVCVLWTIEIGRFRSEESATFLSQEHGTVYEEHANHVPSGDAVVYFESCRGTWQPGSFIVRLSGVAPWSVRRGLYLTHEDAERAAKAWGPRAKAMQQRVDGALLEQALAEPLEGC